MIYQNDSIVFKMEMAVELPVGRKVRMDQYLLDNLSEKLEIHSRNQLKSRIDKILINGKERVLGKKVGNRDHIVLFYHKNECSCLIPQKIPLDIIYEDSQVIVINKSNGMVVHPGSGNKSGTLVNALISYSRELRSGFSEGEYRPGIVHWLDKDTTGLIIVAKNLETQNFLSRQFSERKVKKIYLAVVYGRPLSIKGTIDTHIIRDPANRKRFTCSQTGGRRSVTRFRFIKYLGDCSLMILEPKTGRTHQLRVHMNHLRNPVVGDTIYAGRKILAINGFSDLPLMLHAYKLTIRLPDEIEPKTFKAHLPAEFRKFLSLKGFLSNTD